MQSFFNVRFGLNKTYIVEMVQVWWDLKQNLLLYVVFKVLYRGQSCTLSNLNKNIVILIETLNVERHLDNRFRVLERTRPRPSLSWRISPPLFYLQPKKKKARYIVFVVGGHLFEKRTFHARRPWADSTDATCGWMCVYAWNDSDRFQFRTVSGFLCRSLPVSSRHSFPTSPPQPLWRINYKW